MYPLAVYAGLVLLAPRARPVAVGAITLVWCVAVELFQLTGIPNDLAAALPPVVLVLGTVFDARGLLIYAITAVVVAAAHTALSAGRMRP